MKIKNPTDLNPVIKSIKNRIIFLIFALAIALPSLEMVFRFGPQIALSENRTLAARPVFNAGSAFEYPRLFGAYFADNFGFRQVLIRSNARIKLNYLKVSPIPAIIIGKNGWSFYNSDAVNGGDTIADFRGTSPFSARQLDQVRSNMEAKIKLLSDRHIPYIVVVAPNKNTVYPEFLPDAYNKVTNITKLDQLIDTMKSSIGSNIIDVRPSLIEAKTKHPVYFRHGTHWNEYGAFIGWQEIVKALGKYYPELKEKNEKDYVITTTPNNKEDTVYSWLGVADAFHGEVISLKIKPQTVADNGSFKLHKVLIFGDSFGDWIEKFVHDHFENVIIRSYSKFDLKLIEKESPDVVITEVVERGIHNLLDDYVETKNTADDILANEPPDKRALNGKASSPSTITPYDFSDGNWINGVSMAGDASFFILNSKQARKVLSVGKKLKFADGSVRKILSTRTNGTFLNIYLDGAPLNGATVGYPKMIEIGT